MPRAAVVLLLVALAGAQLPPSPEPPAPPLAPVDWGNSESVASFSASTEGGGWTTLGTAGKAGVSIGGAIVAAPADIDLDLADDGAGIGSGAGARARARTAAPAAAPVRLPPMPSIAARCCVCC